MSFLTDEEDEVGARLAEAGIFYDLAEEWFYCVVRDEQRIEREMIALLSAVLGREVVGPSSDPDVDLHLKNRERRLKALEATRWWSAIWLERRRTA